MALAKQSDAKRAFSEDGELKTHVGGQALLEGIMMRGKLNWAVAVRTPDGSIYVEEHDLLSASKGKWAQVPLVRGCVALVESLMLGFKALEIAALHAFADEDEPVQQNKEAATQVSTVRSEEPAQINAQVKDADDASFGSREMTISLVVGLLLGIVLFIAAPAALTNLLVGEYDDHTLTWNIVDGLLRVAVFILYLWLISRMEDIRRMFMYHGAEHKTIHCYEHGLPLTPENARSFPRLHVRCGTAFLITVMIIAILVYTIFPLNAIISGWGIPDGLPKLLLVIAFRILLMPVIAGVAYEVTVKWAGKRPNNPLVKVILWPGMQLQYLTTNEPDDGQIECAIAAMQRVLEREQKAAV
jgi:uncharacterized protein YqhQ